MKKNTSAPHWENASLTPPAGLVERMPGSRFLYTLTLFGYFGTLILLTAWYSWLAPPTHFPVALILFMMLVPLLFPLRGLLHGRRYTFAWSCFLALLYFIHGVMEAYSSEAFRHLGLVEVLCTTVWFLAAIAYVRTPITGHH